MRDYSEELVYTTTSDGLGHAGLLIQPLSSPPREIAVIWVHGGGGKFYGQQGIRIGRELARRGYSYVSGNNRGHDFASRPMQTWYTGPVPIGAWWELIEDSIYDIAAWIDFMADHGFQSVALLGHSFGAAKVVYYQAQQQDARVATVIAASIPVLPGVAFMDPGLIDLAEEMIANNRGGELMPWGSAVAAGGTCSARTFLSISRAYRDHFSADAANPALAQIRCPLLAFYGSDEEWCGTSRDLEAITQQSNLCPRVETFMVEGADHSYTNHETEVATAIASWL